jgi:hypothetical protein
VICFYTVGPVLPTSSLINELRIQGNMFGGIT